LEMKNCSAENGSPQDFSVTGTCREMCPQSESEL
jgi:hypothetical protein